MSAHRDAIWPYLISFEKGVGPLSKGASTGGCHPLFRVRAHAIAVCMLKTVSVASNSCMSAIHSRNGH
jgi:hypothetical protein